MIQSREDTSNQIKSNQIKSNQIESSLINTNRIKWYQIISCQVKTNPALLCQLHNLHCPENSDGLLDKEVVSQLPHDFDQQPNVKLFDHPNVNIIIEIIIYNVRQDRTLNSNLSYIKYWCTNITKLLHWSHISWRTFCEIISHSNRIVLQNIIMDYQVK